jgi:hypothetical protein
VLSEPLLLGLASSLELVKSVRLFLGRSPRLVFPCIEESVLIWFSTTYASTNARLAAFATLSSPRPAQPTISSSSARQGVSASPPGVERGSPRAASRANRSACHSRLVNLRNLCIYGQRTSDDQPRSCTFLRAGTGCSHPRRRSPLQSPRSRRRYRRTECTINP